MDTETTHNGSRLKTLARKMLSVLQQLKPLWSIPLHSIGSIVAAAFHMKNVVQSGPLNLLSVHHIPSMTVLSRFTLCDDNP